MISKSVEEFATFSVPASKVAEFVAALKAHKIFRELFDVRGDSTTGVITILTNAPIGDGAYARRHGQHLYEVKAHGDWLLQIVGDIASRLRSDLRVTCRVCRFTLGTVSVSNGVIEKNFWDEWDQRPEAELPYRRAV